MWILCFLPYMGNQIKISIWVIPYIPIVGIIRMGRKEIFETFSFKTICKDMTYRQ